MWYSKRNSLIAALGVGRKAGEMVLRAMLWVLQRLSNMRSRSRSLKKASQLAGGRHGKGGRGDDTNIGPGPVLWPGRERVFMFLGPCIV